MLPLFHALDQVNNLREIQALRRLSPHPNIIALSEVLYDKPSGRLALVFELMDANLYEVKLPAVRALSSPPPLPLQLAQTKNTAINYDYHQQHQLIRGRRHYLKPDLIRQYSYQVSFNRSFTCPTSQ
jgi:hypothetical protein